jgi:hypothetical protein
MNNLHPIAQAVQSQGRGKDTQLVHMTPNEVAGMQALAKAHGGSLSINPSTGLPEAGILDSMLPTILGAGAMMIPGMQGVGAGMIGAGIGALQYMRTGSLEKGLMAGLGAYGGAGLGQSLMGAGALGNTGTMSPLNKASQEMLEQKAAVDAATTAATKQSKQVLLDQATKNLAAQQSQIAASSTFGENLSRAGTGLKAAAMSPSTFMKTLCGFRHGLSPVRRSGSGSAHYGHDGSKRYWTS